MFENKELITTFFEEKKLKLKKTLECDEDVHKFKFKKETIQEFEDNIKDLEKNKKDTIPSKRRLTIELCKNYKGYQGDVIRRLEMLENEIPQNEFTPLMCQELMNFYSSIKMNISKATFYYEQLLITNSKNEFIVDRRKVLNFIKALFINQTPLNIIIKLLIQAKWKNIDQINIDLFRNNLIEFLIDYVYKESSASDFENFTEIMFNTNFIERNLMISKLVLIKLIKEKNIKKSIEYFKWNLETNKMCVLELNLMRYYVTKLNNNNKQPNNQEIEIDFANYLSLLSKVFDWNYIYNLVFLAQILNGNFKEAFIIYENDLNKQIDLDVMKKIVDQYRENNILNHQIKYLTNIYKFEPVLKQPTLKQKIQNILNR